MNEKVNVWKGEKQKIKVEAEQMKYILERIVGQKNTEIKQMKDRE